MLRYECVHGRYARNVDDRESRVCLYNRLQQRLHDNLRSCAIQRADQRKCNNSIPERHNRRGKLKHLFLLARNNLVATMNEAVCRVQCKLIDEVVDRGDLGIELVSALSLLLASDSK